MTGYLKIAKLVQSWFYSRWQKRQNNNHLFMRLTKCVQPKNLKTSNVHGYLQRFSVVPSEWSIEYCFTETLKQKCSFHDLQTRNMRIFLRSSWGAVRKWRHHVLRWAGGPGRNLKLRENSWQIIVNKGWHGDGRDQKVRKKGWCHLWKTLIYQ